MKKLITVVLVLVVALVMLSVVKNGIAKMAVSGGVKMVTGLGLDIQSMDVGVLKTLVGIRNLRVLNPRGFPDRVMADVPEVYIDYDLGSFLKGKVHLEEVRLNLQEFTVVKNEKGVLNLDSLKTVQETKEGESSQKKKGKAPEIQIDVLDLQVGKVIYKDYSRGTPPKVSEYNVNLHERHENITNPYVLGSLIVSRALLHTAVAKLADFDLDALEGQVADVMKRSRGILTTTAGSTREAGKEVAGAAKEAAKETTDALKKLFPLGKD